MKVLSEKAIDLIDQLRATVSFLHQMIDVLTNRVMLQKKRIQQLKDEVAVLKGQKTKPKIPPSSLEGPKSKDRNQASNTNEKPGQANGKPRNKKTILEIYDKPIIQPANIPEGVISTLYNFRVVEVSILR